MSPQQKKAQEQPPDPAQLQEVAEAGAAAAAAAESPQEAQEATAAAMRDKAQEINVRISDEDVDRISKQFVDLAMGELQSRGAFDPPPEPVRPPTQAPPAPGEAERQPVPPPPPDAVQEPPRKQTFAERYFS